MLFKQPIGNGSNSDSLISLANRILAQRGQDHALMYVECCSRTTTLAAILAKVKMKLRAGGKHRPMIGMTGVKDPLRAKRRPPLTHDFIRFALHSALRAVVGSGPCWNMQTGYGSS